MEVGDQAPGFSLRDQHGQEQTLAARLRERSVLIVFYPFAFTGVCSSEMAALNEHSATWDELGADVLAVSCDPLASLRAFADRERLAIPLLSDFWPHGAVSTAYGVFEPVLGAAQRASFVIDRLGVVRWTTRSDLGNARDVDGYVAALAEL